MIAHDPSLYAAGAALHALGTGESAEFDRHLRDCSTCQAELAGFSETAARLASVSAEPAPSSMRAAVLAGIAVTRQLPPTPRSEAPLADVVDLSARRRLRSRVLLSAAVAVAVALLAVSAVFMSNRDKTPELAGPEAQRQCVEAATDQHQVVAAAGSAGISKVMVSTSCGAALVQLSAIPAPEPGRTYQLWVMSGNHARSVGTMDPDPTGKMPDTVAPVEVGDIAIGVTVEPVGGSPAPTTPPVITVPLSS